jgi:hypothetical protein
MIGSQLQKAIFAALTDADVCGDRVYDRVPKGAVFPYVTIGDEQVIDDGNTCADAWEIFPDVHVWSRPGTGSKVELKDTVAAVVAAVRGIAAVTDYTVILAELSTSRTLRDPDGITEHAVLTFRFLLEPA